MTRTAREQANLDRVIRMYREVLIAMNPDKVDQHLSPRYIQHSSLAEPGLPALKQFLGLGARAKPAGHPDDPSCLRRRRARHRPRARGAMAR